MYVPLLILCAALQKALLKPLPGVLPEGERPAQPALAAVRKMCN
jgi:hypothetical protein